MGLRHVCQPGHLDSGTSLGTGFEVPGARKNRLDLYWPQKGPMTHTWILQPGAASAGSREAPPEHVDDDDTLPDPRAHSTNI